MNFQERNEHAKKHCFQSFDFEGIWYDTFKQPKATAIPQKYINALYELIGDFTENAYYDIEDKIINLRSKTFYSHDYECSWGDFLVTNIFMRFVNYKRKIIKIEIERDHHFAYSEILENLVNEYLKESEEI